MQSVLLCPKEVNTLSSDQLQADVRGSMSNVRVLVSYLGMFYSSSFDRISFSTRGCTANCYITYDVAQNCIQSGWISTGDMQLGNFKGRNEDNGSKMVCKRIRKVQKMPPIYSPLFQLLMHSRIKTGKICHHAFRRKPAISQSCLPK